MYARCYSQFLHVACITAQLDFLLSHHFLHLLFGLADTSVNRHPEIQVVFNFKHDCIGTQRYFAGFVCTQQ